MAATTTGRLSSSDPNLQNIPIRTEEGRKIRDAFIAETGHVLVAADYSQIELRLLAHVADLPTMKQAFADGVDIHALTASEMFDVSLEDMDAATRRRAKAINFGIIYGISAFGLANNLGISRTEASEYIKSYFQKFPGIKAYMDAAKSEAQNMAMSKHSLAANAILKVSKIATKRCAALRSAKRLTPLSKAQPLILCAAP